VVRLNPSATDPQTESESLNALDDLAVKHGTDKGTIATAKLTAKRYTVPYFRYLERVRNDPLVLLEIGVDRGSSLRMWEDFLPNARLLAVDIAPRCARFATERTSVLIGDQSDPGFLESVVEAAGGGFDAIIDDGSHQMVHHQASLAFLWPYLREGGWYAIEDLHTCYSETFGGGHLNPQSTVERVLKPMVDALNAPRSVAAPFIPGVESVHVYRSVTFLFKEEASGR
jgi:hypothetical protein